MSAAREEAVPTKEEQAFRKEQMWYGGRYFQIMCALLLGMETFLLLVYVLSHTPGKPALDRGYLHFYLAAIGIGGTFLVLTRVFRRRGQWLYRLQGVGLSALLLWGCLFSRYDVLHGNGGAAMPQIMLFAAAGLRFPRALHYGLNISCWALYLLLLGLGRLPLQTFYSEAINSGIYLFIACAVISITARFQTAQAEAVQKVLQLQGDNLDMMAAQMEEVRKTVEETRIFRHDLRHIAFAIYENAKKQDCAGVLEIVEKVLKKTERPEAQGATRKFTGVAEIDTALSRCAAWAEQEKVCLGISVQRPDGMDTRAFSLALLNALENACHAVSRQSGGERSLDVLGEVRGRHYYLEITNSYEPGSVRIHPVTGLPVAQGRGGHGYGAQSVARIVEDHQGYWRFQTGEKFRFQALFTREAEP